MTDDDYDDDDNDDDNHYSKLLTTLVIPHKIFSPFDNVITEFDRICPEVT